MTQTELAAPPRQDPVPGWGQGLAEGAAGITLLHIEHARAGTSRWDLTHRWAAAMTRSPVSAHPGSCGLYRGAPAVAFTLHAADQPGYAKVLATLERHVSAITRRRLENAHERISRGQLPALREFDLIRGLTGMGVYLLHRHGDSGLTRDVLSYLVRLTQPVPVESDLLPGWWCGNGPGDQPSPQWPGGHGNLGLAHGISGPLALLSAAARHGVTVPGHADAIRRICGWLDQWRNGTGTQAWWPGMISLPEHRARTIQQHGPGRPSWCYGTPGLARALQLAALALADPRRQRHAEQALAGCVTDEAQLAQIGDASLCHGWAGLLHTTWRTASVADDGAELRAAVPHLLQGLEKQLHDHRPVSDGLLEGMTGVLLARQAATTDGAPITRWDACLLLEG